MCILEWRPTLTFKPASYFYDIDGVKIKYSTSCVTRFIDFNEDGKMDFMVTNKGRLWVHFGAANGR